MQGEESTDPGLGDGIVVRTIFEALWNAAIDFWYVWLLLVIALVALTLLNDWSKRVAARRKGAPGQRR